MLAVRPDKTQLFTNLEKGKGRSATVYVTVTLCIKCAQSCFK